jgi:hypothetical protein
MRLYNIIGHTTFDFSNIAWTVEGLYCKRPIQSLASSKLLTPHPLTARRVCILPPYGAGGGQTRWVERGWGGKIWKMADIAHAVLYIRKYFVALTVYRNQLKCTSGKPLRYSEMSS